MCLTVPGRVISIESQGEELRIARVDFGVAERPANLLFTPEVKVGDFVIVQSGFATRRVSEEEAAEALAYLEAATRPSAAAEAGADPGQE